MAEEQDLGKLLAPPLQETNEKAGEAASGELKNESVQKKLDGIAMRLAKRAENRFHANAGRVPGSTIFSK
jgi:hypothetical protein